MCDSMSARNCRAPLDHPLGHGVPGGAGGQQRVGHDVPQPHGEPRTSRTALSAAMPLAKATAASVPSSRASAVSKRATVGLPSRP